MTAPVTTYDSMLPTHFVVPLANPSPGGLYPATTWTEETGPTRWLDSGVEVRGENYGGENTWGVWGVSWCADPGDLGPKDIKTGTRPDELDPFQAITVWAADSCDLTEPTRFRPWGE